MVRTSDQVPLSSLPSLRHFPTEDGSYWKLNDDISTPRSPIAINSLVILLPPVPTIRFQPVFVSA